MGHDKQIIVPNAKHASFAEMIRFRFVFERMLMRDIKSFSGSSIGDYISLILKPLFLAAIIGLLKSKHTEQPVLLSFTTVYYGLLYWWIFADNLKSSINIFKRNRSIISKIYIPKMIIVMSMFSARLYGVFLQFIVGSFFLFLLKPIIDFTSALIIFFTLFSIIFLSFNLCLGISVMALKYRSIRTISEFMLFSMFFTMPITFNVDILGSYLVGYFLLNPIGSAIALVKDVIGGGNLDYAAPMFSLLLWLIASLLLINYFSKHVETTVESI